MNLSKIISFHFFLTVWFGVPVDVLAMGRQSNTKMQNIEPKHVIEFHGFPNRYIEIPGDDNSTNHKKINFIYEYGRNISDGVISKLVSSNRFVVVEPKENAQNVQSMELALKGNNIESDPIWLEDKPLPVMSVRGQVKELWFSTGEKADRTLYGFREGFTNGFNEGLVATPSNEFLYSMGPAFSDYGGLHIGMDLGSSINFDIFWAGAGLKHNRFRAGVGVEIQLENVLTGEITNYKERYEKGGFYFELVGQYLNYFGGIMLARRDALQKSFEMVKTEIANRLGEELLKTPQRFNLYFINNKYFIAGGQLNYGIKDGNLFYLRSDPKIQFKVEKSFAKISSLKGPVSTSPVYSGEVILWDGKSPPISVTHVSEALVSNFLQSNAPQIDHSSNWTLRSSEMSGVLPVVKGLIQFIQQPVKRFFKALVNLATLPLRISRFASYDQDYYGPNGKSFDGSRSVEFDEDRYYAVAESQWAYNDIHLTAAWDKWKQTTGTDLVSNTVNTNNSNILVAILDSGVDYNHQDLRRNIATDPWRKKPGFDFYSGDGRAYDDHGHGTAVAGTVAGGAWSSVGVWPRAKILPVKIFNPYGYTTSAALFAGIQYAVKSRADILLIGWAGSVDSLALKQGLKLAEDNHILVVVAAGDEGLNLNLRPQFPASYVHDFNNILVVGAYGDGPQNLGSVPMVPKASPNNGDVVQIIAPGIGVHTTMPRNNYKKLTLTGISAGFVAGTAAFLFDYLNVKGCGATKNERLDLVKSALLQQPPSPKPPAINAGIHRLSVYYSLMALIQWCGR